MPQHVIDCAVRELTYIIGSDDSETHASWPAKLTYDKLHYNHKSKQSLPLGWVKPKFPSEVATNLPKRIFSYFPEQELWHTKVILLVGLQPGARQTLGNLDGNFEAICRRLSSWIDGGEMRHFISEAAFEEHIRQMQLDTQTLIDHEIRTPLSVIEGYSRMVETWVDKIPEARQFAEVISVQIGSAVEALEKLTLALRGGFDRCQKQGASDDIKILPMIRQVVYWVSDSLITEALAEKAVDISIVAPDDAEQFSVFGVQHLLENALQEVVKNAVLYSGKGKVKINLYRSEGSLVLDVEDDGSGVPVGSEDLVFLKFYRAVVPGKQSQHRGIGLGLNIAKQIAEQHAGQLIYVRKGPDNRGLFRFILPMAERESVAS